MSLEYKYEYEGHSITWGFSDIVHFALLQIEQTNAGCPADCQENPLSCDKEPDEMPRQCKEDLQDDLEREHIELDWGGVIEVDQTGIPDQRMPDA
jgi:hypothetical protein